MLSYAMLSGAIVGCASPWDDVGFEMFGECVLASATQSFLAKLQFSSKSILPWLEYAQQQPQYLQLLEHLLGKYCVYNVIENFLVQGRKRTGFILNMGRNSIKLTVFAAASISPF